MIEVEQTIPVLLLILLVGLLLPDIFKKLRLPFVSSIILMGALFGPHGLNYIHPNEVIEFFGFLGSAFLMLMAGLEVKLEHFQKMGKKIILMAALNGGIPFFAGMLITLAFGYSAFTALLMGTIFISSSIAIIVLAAKESNLLDTEMGKTLVSVVVIEDLAGLFLLAIILQGVSPITPFPLPVYFFILIVSIVFLKKFLNFVGKFYFFETKHLKDNYEKELRFVLVVLMGALLYFSGLGVHPIVAAFLVGLLLSDVVKSDIVYSKLHTMGYGLFVPVFLFVVGMEINLNAIVSVQYGNALLVSIIVGSIIAKVLSGFIAGRWAHFSKKQSMVFGIALMSQLTTMLAETYAVASLGLLDGILVTSIIALALVTSILAPFILKLMTSEARKTKRESVFELLDLKEWITGKRHELLKNNHVKRQIL